MTIAIVSNYHGSSLYRVAKALYAALPQFLCGNTNRKEDKIVLSFNGTNICIARSAALVQINKGAYLGSLENQLVETNRNNGLVTAELLLKEDAGFSAYPNPFSQHISISFKAAETGMVSLQLFDLHGKMIKRVFEENAQKGMVKQFKLTSEGMPAGTYISRLKTSAGMSQRKIISNK